MFSILISELRPSFATAQRLGLDPVLLLERLRNVLEVLDRARGNEVVAVDHDGNTQLAVMEETGVVSPLGEGCLAQCFAVFLGPIQCGVTSAIH